jgi:hypothetical protein
VTPSGVRQQQRPAASRGCIRRTAIVQADDRFDRGDGPEPACALATSESRRSSRPGAGRTIAFAPAGRRRRRRARLPNATHSTVVPRAGGRLHGPDDAQVEPREVAVGRRAIASVGHLTAGSSRFQSQGRGRRHDRIRVALPRRLGGDHFATHSGPDAKGMRQPVNRHDENAVLNSFDAPRANHANDPHRPVAGPPSPAR